MNKLAPFLFLPPPPQQEPTDICNQNHSGIRRRSASWARWEASISCTTWCRHLRPRSGPPCTPSPAPPRPSPGASSILCPAVPTARASRPRPPVRRPGWRRARTRVDKQGFGGEIGWARGLGCWSEAGWMEEAPYASLSYLILAEWEYSAGFEPGHGFKTSFYGQACISFPLV